MGHMIVLKIQCHRTSFFFVFVWCVCGTLRCERSDTARTSWVEFVQFSNLLDLEAADCSRDGQVAVSVGLGFCRNLVDLQL